MRILCKAAAGFVIPLLILAMVVGCAATPTAGVSGATVDSSGNLIISLNDGSTTDVGYVIGPTGATGATGAAGPTGPSGLSGGGTQSASVSSLILSATASIVYIDVISSRGETIGSGVVIGTQGYILTCYHTVNGATSLKVTLNSGATIPATFVTGAQSRDYAVIKLNTVPSGLQAATLGSSAGAAVGDPVVLGGFALAYTPNPSFSYGIISALRKLSDGYNYIQTDAAMNLNDGGGPLLNMAGQVIGINDQADIVDNNGDPVLNMAYCLPIDEITAAIQSYTG